MQVVEETIRLANIAPMAHRVALRDVEYRGGYRYIIYFGHNFLEEL